MKILLVLEIEQLSLSKSFTSMLITDTLKPLLHFRCVQTKWRLCMRHRYKATLARSSGEGKGFGAWGQFIQSDLSVNRARAGLLRRELRFAKHGHASTVMLEDFAAHVARQLAKARL